jgi:ABC-type amino acid transport system permease subunit
MSENHYWFRKRRPGKGGSYVPASREGWIATLIFFILDTGGVAILIPLFAETHWWIIIAWVIGWTTAFLAVLFAKGEPLW